MSNPRNMNKLNEVMKAFKHVVLSHGIRIDFQDKKYDSEINKRTVVPCTR